MLEQIFVLIPCILAFGVGIFYLYRQRKKMLLVVLLAPLAIALFIFPFDDLSDKIINLVASRTNSQVFLQFKSLGLSPFPPSIKMEEVIVETPFFNPLKASRLNLAPTLVGGLSANAKEILNGDLSLNYRTGKKVDDRTQLHKVSIDYNHVDLNKLAELLNVRGKLKGSVDLNVDSEFDQSFAIQPTVEGDIAVAELVAESLALGLFTLPDIKASEFNANFNLKDGKLKITDATIGGKAGDSFNGKISGEIDIRLQLDGPNVRAIPGQYSFNIELTIDKAIEKPYEAYFQGFGLTQYRSLTSGGSRYAFNAAAPNTMGLPTFTPIKR